MVLFCFCQKLERKKLNSAQQGAKCRQFCHPLYIVTCAFDRFVAKRLAKLGAFYCVFRNGSLESQILSCFYLKIKANTVLENIIFVIKNKHEYKASLQKLWIDTLEIQINIRLDLNKFIDWNKFQKMKRMCIFYLNYEISSKWDFIGHANQRFSQGALLSQLYYIYTINRSPSGWFLWF